MITTLTLIEKAIKEMNELKLVNAIGKHRYIVPVFVIVSRVGIGRLERRGRQQYEMQQVTGVQKYTELDFSCLHHNAG